MNEFSNVGSPGCVTPGWGRNSWAEAPFQFGDWLFLPLMMTPAPSSSHKFLLTPFHLLHSLPASYRSGALQLRCPGQPGIWGILCQRIWKRRLTQSPCSWHQHWPIFFQGGCVCVCAPKWFRFQARVLRAGGTSFPACW